MDARWQVWDEPSADWSGGTTVLRSTWDYTLRRDAFLAWVAGLPAVHNSVEVVRWNSDKRYLLELAAAGLPVTPTQLAAPGLSVELPAFGRTDAHEVIVKPSVGAGSRGAGRFRRDEHDEALAHVAALHAAGRTVMMQPYLRGVDVSGETALVAFGGRVAHAVRKGAMLQEGTRHEVIGPSLFTEEDISARTPSPAELEVGRRALDFLAERFGGPLLYARIDLLPTDDGPVIVEVEAVEPSLFFTYAPGSARRWAEQVAGRVVDRQGGVRSSR